LVKDPTVATVYLLDASQATAPISTPTKVTPAGAGDGSSPNGDAASGASSGCTASVTSNLDHAWFFVPFAAIAVARRRRRTSSPRGAGARANVSGALAVANRRA
jgi:hypothetical protein